MNYLSTSDIHRLPEQLEKNIEAIINLQTQLERKIPVHQRILEKIAATFGKPWFFYAQVIFFAAWGYCSHLADTGLLIWDLPRFTLKEQGIDAASLMIATGVLIRQTREEQLEEKRSHLALQVNLLTEQKITKLIRLVEELRVDLPGVRNRHDAEAEVMQQTANPQIVLDILQKNLTKAGLEEEVVSTEINIEVSGY